MPCEQRGTRGQEFGGHDEATLLAASAEQRPSQKERQERHPLREEATAKDDVRRPPRAAFPGAIGPGGNGKQGFSSAQGSRQTPYPTHLLAGSMVCGSCGATIAQVSGKNGGYYGCLAATKGACDNKTLVRRTLAEKVILEAVRTSWPIRSTSRTSSAA